MLPIDQPSTSVRPRRSAAISALVWSAIASIVSGAGRHLGLADTGVVERDDAVALGERVDEAAGPSSPSCRCSR